MGLATSRKRQKLSHDPNNTAWTRATGSYGHKLLTSQGWAPGETLGVANAAHAAHFTPASASHVRVTLREDNLGLGAATGSGQGAGECIGLGGLQDLLGRLNGKSEDALNKERKGRADAQRVIYADRKFGGWGRFVSGGVLLGGDLFDGLGSKATAPHSAEKSSMKLETESGKRAVTDALIDGPDETAAEKPPADRKQRKKSSKSSRKARNGNGELNSQVLSALSDDVAVGPGEIPKDASVTSRGSHQRAEDKARRKAEKAQRKLERQKRREDKARQNDCKDLARGSSTIPKADEMSAICVKEKEAVVTTAPTSVAIFPRGRQAVRQRYILQKKAAMMDSRALNEILMVKA